MRKKCIITLISIVVFITPPLPSEAEIIDTSHESTELQIHDMFMLFLSNPIQTAVTQYYSKLLTQSPTVYPYEIFIIKITRVNGFRGFHFRITLEVSPVVGPHISVGKDRLILEISPMFPEQIKLVEYTHLETHDLPPNWKHIVKKP